MQFSLKALVVSVVICALGLSLWTVSQRLRDVTAELRDQRHELGHLNVTDAEKINFITVPQHEDMKWRWRVQLPVGRKYNLCFSTIGISDIDFPQPHCTLFVEGGDEFTITVLCHRDQRNNWKLTAMTTAGHTQNLGFLGPAHHAWFEGQTTHSFSVGAQDQTTSANADGPAELLRLRIKDSNNAPTEDGLLVWITQATER